MHTVVSQNVNLLIMLTLLPF